jgi:hypothetical protein
MKTIGLTLTVLMMSIGWSSEASAWTCRNGVCVEHRLQGLWLRVDFHTGVTFPATHVNIRVPTYLEGFPVGSGQYESRLTGYGTPRGSFRVWVGARPGISYSIQVCNRDWLSSSNCAPFATYWRVLKWFELRRNRKLLGLS